MSDLAFSEENKTFEHNSQNYWLEKHQKSVRFNRL